jgi:hypothetical protein
VDEDGVRISEVKAQMPTKSLSAMRADFCEKWRREKTDEEFLEFIKMLVCLEDQDTKRRKEVVRNFLALVVGNDWYDISTDTLWHLTP